MKVIRDLSSDAFGSLSRGAQIVTSSHEARGRPSGALIPRRNSLSDEVYRRLKSLIMDGSIPPGMRINIENVSRQLAVSPTPVRESLARLEADELVHKLPLKGYRTTDLLDQDGVREIYDLRLLLEPPSARLAAQRMTSEWADSLRQEMATCSRAPEGSDYEAYQALASHDERLHGLILAVAGNAMVQNAFARTHCHLHIFRLSYVDTFGTHTLREHQEVVDALVSGNPADAESAMRDHLSASRTRMISRFDRPPVR